MNSLGFTARHTLDETNPDVYYQKTRLFYESMGFKPLGVFPLLWDECNPCLLLAKSVTFPVRTKKTKNRKSNAR